MRLNKKSNYEEENKLRWKIIIKAIYNVPCLSKIHSWCRRDAKASGPTMSKIDEFEAPWPGIEF